MLHVSINMATSMDGKIATAKRGPMKLGTEYDSHRMEEIRALQDLVINGAATFRAYPRPLSIRNAELLEQRRSAGLSEQPISALVSSRLDLPRGTPYEKAAPVERWIFCGSKASKKTVASWEKSGVRVWQSRKVRPEAKEIYKIWEKQGLRNVLLEGGGELNASFLEAGLVNRIHLTFCPLLIGGTDSPTFCEGKVFKKFPRFHLAECREVGDELYLTYERS